MHEGAPVTPEIVDWAVFLEELDLAADGETAYVVRRSTAGIEYQQEIWAVPMDGGEPRRLTRGPSDTHPRVSVDGRSLAFLSKRKAAKGDGAPGIKGRETDGARNEGDGGGKTEPGGKAADEPKTQVWVLPIDGGEAWQLTREEHDVSGFAWSPDGGRIAFWGWRGPARFIVGKRDDDKPPTARHITVGGWRWNETGHLDHRTHLAVTDVAEGADPVAVTEGDYDVANPVWHPDGRSWRGDGAAA